MIGSFNEAVKAVRRLERATLEVDLYVTTLRGPDAKGASLLATRTRRALIDFLKGLDIPTTGGVETRLSGRKAALRRMPKAGTLGESER